MRCLLPRPVEDVSYGDLVSLYDFPDSGGQCVRATFIQSVDGAAQGADNRSGSLSSPADRRIFALQRSLCDAVLVGASTARTEGYLPVRESEVDMSLRASLGLAGLPAIVVVTRTGIVDQRLLDDDRTFVATNTLSRSGTQAAVSADRVIASGGADVDLAQVLKALRDKGFHRIACEGGPTLMAGLTAIGALNDLCLTTSPVLLGGDRRRILQGADLVPPASMRLAHLLVEGDDLFARYVVEPALSTSARS